MRPVEVLGDDSNALLASSRICITRVEVIEPDAKRVATRQVI